MLANNWPKVGFCSYTLQYKNTEKGEISHTQLEIFWVVHCCLTKPSQKLTSGMRIFLKYRFGLAKLFITKPYSSLLKKQLKLNQH